VKRDGWSRIKETFSSPIDHPWPRQHTDETRPGQYHDNATHLQELVVRSIRLSLLVQLEHSVRVHDNLDDLYFNHLAGNQSKLLMAIGMGARNECKKIPSLNLSSCSLSSRNWEILQGGCLAVNKVMSTLEPIGQERSKVRG